MYCTENKQVFNKIQVIMYIKLFENIDAGTSATNGQFFLSVYSNNYPLTNSFQIVIAINPKFKTIADG